MFCLVYCLILLYVYMIFSEFLAGFCINLFVNVCFVL